jgi:MFS family permease
VVSAGNLTDKAAIGELENNVKDDNGRTYQPWLQFSQSRRFVMLAVLFLVGTSAAMDRAVITVVLEQVRIEFGLSDSMLGFVSGAPFGICYALSSVPLARMADRYGRKKVLFWSGIGWSIMTAACGLAITLPLLIVARMGVGAAEGGAVAPSHALIADYFPPERRGLALAILTSSGTLGMLIATSAGGYITETYGWRMAFLFMAAISAPIVLLVLGVLIEPTRPSADSAAGKPNHWRDDYRALGRKGSYLSIVVALLCFSMLPFGVVVFSPTFMVRVHELDMAQAGALFGISIAIGTMIGSLGGGLLSDALRKRSEHFLLLMPALLFFATVPSVLVGYGSSSLTVFLVLQSVTTALSYASLPSMFAAIQHVCGSSRRATAVASALLMLNAIGVAVAPLIVGVLSDLYAGFGELSLRYAILTIVFAMIPGGIALLWGSRRLAADAES